jgi:hypothetical protein
MPPRASHPASLHVLITLLAAGTCAAPALAQADAGRSPLEGATQPATDAPVTAVPSPATPPGVRSPDPEIVRFVDAFVGGYATDPRPGEAGLVMHVAPATVQGLSTALLIEVARADSPWAPFRVYFVHPYRRQGTLRLRTLDFPPGPAGADPKGMLAGMWAAPDAMPRVELSQLVPSMDMPLFIERGAYRATTPQPAPTTRDGATEMTSSLLLTPEGLTVADAGFDETGKQVWGVASSAPVVLRKLPSVKASVTRLDGGLVIITVAEPPANAPRLEPDGQLTAHYSGWLGTGQMFDSTRLPGRQPMSTRNAPGTVIKGWIEGVRGIAKGERRKLVIPAELGFGATARPGIPAGSTLIFDVEAVDIDNTPLQPAPAPAPTGGHGGMGQPATPAAPAPEKPADKPADAPAPKPASPAPAETPH